MAFILSRGRCLHLTQIKLVSGEDTCHGGSYHESLHFTGLSDQYDNAGIFPEFANDIMGRYGAFNIGIDHYQQYYRKGTNPVMLEKYPDGFINKIMIDRYPDGFLIPATQDQLNEQNQK